MQSIFIFRAGFKFSIVEYKGEIIGVRKQDNSASDLAPARNLPSVSVLRGLCLIYDNTSSRQTCLQASLVVEWD